MLIQTYDRRANCLLSRSCHHCAIIRSMDHAFYTYSRVHARELECASTRACAPRAPFALHVNDQPTRVSSSLLALICQVSCDLYCISYSKQGIVELQYHDHVYLYNGCEIMFTKSAALKKGEYLPSLHVTLFKLNIVTSLLYIRTILLRF